jgi:hypothetical protein
MASRPSQIPRNFFVAEQEIQLQNGVGGAMFGKSIAQYEIHKRRDVRNLGSTVGYLLALKHRILIPNQTPYKPGPSSTAGYSNYPAILLNEVTITANNDATVMLRQMFPKTLNSSVSTSASADNGSNNTVTSETTSGSSHTNVNTFGVGITAGFFGDSPMASLTLDYSHSWERSSYDARMAGVSTGATHNVGAGETMSVKDWSSYGCLDTGGVNPSWIWGQSYPWDVIQYNQSSNGSTIDLPSFVTDRLINGELVLPPSQLSQFGVDFTMTAAWMIDFPKGIESDETIKIKHKTTSFTASHNKSGTSVAATLQSATSASEAVYDSGALSLSDYSLIPLNGPGAGNGSAIGFTTTPFTFAPTDPKSGFKIVSPANTLLVKGQGFAPGMTTDFSAPVKLSLTFKIADYSGEYALLLMHWIGEKSGACRLAWTVNETHGGVLYVDAPEGGGGQGNLTSLALRDTDFTSINFHDYLIIGTNVVDLEITAADKTAEYTLFATAIGAA